MAACRHRCRNKTACKHICCKRGLALPAPVDDTPDQQPQIQELPAQELTVNLFDLNGASRVLEIREIRDMILLHFTPAELFPLRRVSKEWNQAIGGTKLDKNLFVSADNRVIEHNIDRLGPWGETLVAYFANDALFKVRPKDHQDIVYLDLLRNPVLVEPNDPRLALFITQPPCQRADPLGVLHVVKEPTEDRNIAILDERWEIDELDVPTGITYGHIVTAFKAQADRLSRSGSRYVGFNIYRSCVMIDNALDASKLRQEEPLPEWIQSWRQRSKDAFEN